MRMVLFVLGKCILVAESSLEVLFMQFLSDFVVPRSSHSSLERILEFVKLPEVLEFASLVLHTLAEADVGDTKLGFIVLY